MNPLMLELAASITAASILGLVVGWMIRSASARRMLARQRTFDQQLQAEMILDKQTEIDELVEQVIAGNAERNDLAQVNRSLEQALTRLEQLALRQRSAAIEQRLRDYDAAVPATGGRPDEVDWNAEPADETQLLNMGHDHAREDVGIDATVMLTDSFDGDATLALEHPFGGGSSHDEGTSGAAREETGRVSGFVKRELPNATTARKSAHGTPST